MTRKESCGIILIQYGNLRNHISVSLPQVNFSFMLAVIKVHREVKNMEKVINSYECLFIVDVTKGDDVTAATVNKFTSLIEANAEVVDVAAWGKRRLAYPINDMPEGYYTVVTFKSAPEFPSECERLFNIDESVMRSMIVKLDYDAAAKKAARAVVEEAAAVADEAAAETAEEAAPEATDAE